MVAGRRAARLHQEQVAGPAMQPVGDHHVLVAVPHHVHQAVLQRLDLFAQHLGLALLQAHGAVAVRARQLHRRQQFGMAREEVGRVGQVVGDVVFGDRVHGIGFHSESGTSISPSNTVTAGPVISTGAGPCAPGPAHSIVSRPPRVCTSTLRSSRPSRMPATTAAQAPGAAGQRFAGAALPHPQADCGAVDHLHEAGVHAVRKARMVFDQRTLGPPPAPASTSATSCTACGIAHRQDRYRNDGGVGVRRQAPGATFPSRLRLAATGRRASKGMAAGSNTGGPMSTVTRPSGVQARLDDAAQRCAPARCRAASGPCRAQSARSSARRCRTARPRRRRRCGSRIRNRCPGAGDGRTESTWSAPTPKWRSARKRYCAGREVQPCRASRRARRSRCRRPASW